MQDFSTVNAKWLRREVLASLDASRRLQCSGRALQCIAVCAGGRGGAPPLPLRLTLSDTQNCIDVFPSDACLDELLRAADLDAPRELAGATLEVADADVRSRRCCACSCAWRPRAWASRAAAATGAWATRGRWQRTRRPRRTSGAWCATRRRWPPARR